MGNRPLRGSDRPKTAAFPATLISVPCKISVPPARAKPSTAAMIGLFGLLCLSNDCQCKSGISLSFSIMSESSFPSFIALKSAPEQKVPPAPVKTAQRKLDLHQAFSKLHK